MSVLPASNMSFRDMMRSMERQTARVKNKRYTLLLEFVNKWLHKSEEEGNALKVLTKFRYVEERELIKKKKYNRKLIKEYAEKFTKILGIDIAVNKDTPDKKISETYILHVVRKGLKSVDHILRSQKNQNNKKCYSICIRSY